MAYDLASYMNPLPISRRIVAAEERAVVSAASSVKAAGTAILNRAERDAAKAARVVGESTAIATQPIAGAGGALGQGLSDVGSGMVDLGNKTDAAAKKVFLGEMIVAAVALAGLGLTWWLSTRKKPEARS